MTRSIKEQEQLVLWSWVHLSDIHVGHGGPGWQSNQEDVLRLLQIDIKAQLGVGVPPPQAIVVTGDIAFSGGGSDREYAKAADLVDKVRKAVGRDIPVYAVPGNHDVQRTKEGPGPEYRLITSIREGRDDIDDCTSNAQDGELLRGRFANYEAFCAAILAPTGDGCDGQWTVRIDTESPVAVRLIGWNTALLSNDDNDFNVLRLGKRAVDAALGAVGPDEVVLALTHHPVSWLENQDASYVTSRLWRDVDVHLHGHVHAADSLRAVRGDGHTLISLIAGAVHAEQDAGGAQTAHAYNFGALVQTGVDYKLRIWPRRWSGNRAEWVTDVESTPDGATHITHPIRLTDTTKSAHDSHDTLRSLAETLLGAAGRRRTAYPTDMSIRELFDRDLVVPALGTTSSGHRSSLVEALLRSRPRGNALILGDPGSGKTVLSYEITRTLLHGDDGTIPLLVSLSALQSDEPGLQDLLTALDSNSTIQHDVLGEGQLVLIVDGVDEALAAGMTATTVSQRLTALFALAPAVVLCRRHDYETRLAVQLGDGLFDSLYMLEDWSQDQFADFIGRLHRSKLLPDTSLVETVKASPALTGLVRRPLRARMLTYLADSGDLPRSVTSLYTAYLTRLGSVTDARVRAIGCGHEPTALSLWRKIAWVVFCAGVSGTQHMPPERLIQIAAGDGLSPECALRSLAGIIDLLPGGQSAAFIHHSLFEFLVAQYVTEGLSESARGDPKSAAGFLTRDLPVEVRRHLVKLLRDINALDIHRWPDYLVGVYRASGELPNESHLTVGNLIAYIMCRLGVPADDQLQRLLEDEDDPFLRNSLLWALTRCDNRPALNTYLDDLGSDPVLSSLNRGYLLYYYGDIRVSLAPPHADIEPYAGWSHTREALNSKYDHEEYERVPLARRAIDVYTFCDIAHVRGDLLTEREYQRFTSLLENLARDGLTGRPFDVLTAKLATVAP